MKERLPMGTFPSYLEKFIEPESCRKCNSREKCKQVIIEGNDAIVILPTMDMTTDQKNAFSYGTKVNVAFGGNVVHLFSKETENNLED